MESWYQEHRNYASYVMGILQNKIDLICLLDEQFCEEYATYLGIVYTIEEELEDEINERQEEQELPTKEKIDIFVVEMMLDTFIDPEETISFATQLEKYNHVFN